MQVLTQKLGRSKAALQETLLRLSRSNLQKAGQVGNIIFVFILVFVLVEIRMIRIRSECTAYNVSHPPTTAGNISLVYF